MAHFFIDRPILAAVIMLLIMITGIFALVHLPIEQYPEIAPPTVTISASYPGADAKTVENGVVQILEQKLTGIDYLRYFTSTSADGSAIITLTFEPEADPDIAQVQTQNKVFSSISQLPEAVQRLGVTVAKGNTTFLLVVALYAKDPRFVEKDLGDLLASKIVDPIARVKGVGNVTLFGEPHAMRIWLNPDQLWSFGLTPLEVRDAIMVQNSDTAAGALGALPSIKGQQLNATLTAQSRLQTVEEFENIVLRVNEDGSEVYLRDVARVELGSDGYHRIVRYKRHPAAGIAVALAPHANALATVAAVKAKMEELSHVIPEGIKVIYPLDNSTFIKLSIHNVVKTLIEAMVLVILVMYLFLQSVRVTIIPAIAVPVVLLGTLAILALFGFTINVLTMFAMLLAIGLLVDDAIVVVENIERLMDEEQLSAKEATRKSMDQITKALVGIALVLSAVFIPMAFFGGSAGAIYRQFSIPIASAMLLSVFVAIVFSPSLCARILQPKNKEGRFFATFNRTFTRSRNFYEWFIEKLLHHPFLSCFFYLLIGGIVLILAMDLPTSFLPEEDQGVLFLIVNGPIGSTAETTLETMERVENDLLQKEGENLDHLFTVVGYNIAATAQNVGLGFLGMKDWSLRERPDQTVFAISNKLMGQLKEMKDAFVFIFFPPAIRELGNASGFDLQIVDRAGLGHEALMEARRRFLTLASQNSKLVGVRPNGLDDVPTLKVEIERNKAKALSIDLASIYSTIEIAWGSSYVNDFLDNGRIKKVYLQGDALYRMLPEDIAKWYVRNLQGEMVPFSSFSHNHWSYASPKLERFNGVASVNIQGGVAPGVSSGQAMMEIEKIAEELPQGFVIEWSGLSYEERLTGSHATLLYAISLLIIFLCLAALYESWSIPIAVLLAVPLAILGTLLATWLSRLSNDVYFQVALLTTIGLVAKNAILIVEFAKRLYEEGEELSKAALLAARLRFRPIIMTSAVFTLGVTPLAVARGAGSASQNAIGIGVMGGMIAATTLAIAFVPLFYVAIESSVFRGNRREKQEVK